MSNDQPTPTTRRDILKKAAFVAPIVLSLPAGAAFAKQGSGRGNDKDKDKDKDN